MYNDVQSTILLLLKECVISFDKFKKLASFYTSLLYWLLTSGGPMA